MFAVEEKNFYVLNMMDYREHRPAGEPPGLDGMVSGVYGRLYIGQQTGDMLSNDTEYTYHMSDSDVAEYLEDTDYDYDGKHYHYDGGRKQFMEWLADDTEYKYDFDHYRQAPVPQVALAMLIADGHLPYGTYLIRVSW